MLKREILLYPPSHNSDIPYTLYNLSTLHNHYIPTYIISPDRHAQASDGTRRTCAISQKNQRDEGGRVVRRDGRA